MTTTVEQAPTQLGPEDKVQFSPFSYAEAIIKEDVTYPIVPNCPIINAGDFGVFDVSNIPVGTLFIVHFPYGDGREERLLLRVPNDITLADDGYGPGYVMIQTRWKTPTSPGGGYMTYI